MDSRGRINLEGRQPPEYETKQGTWQRLLRMQEELVSSSEGARREEKELHVYDYGDCVSSSSVFRCRGEGLLHMLKPRLSMYVMKKRLSKYMKPP